MVRVKFTIKDESGKIGFKSYGFDRDLSEELAKELVAYLKEFTKKIKKPASGGQ